jgi:hypothetical protein
MIKEEDFISELTEHELELRIKYFTRAANFNGFRVNSVSIYIGQENVTRSKITVSDGVHSD